MDRWKGTHTERRRGSRPVQMRWLGCKALQLVHDGRDPLSGTGGVALTRDTMSYITSSRRLKHGPCETVARPSGTAVRIYPT